MKILILSRKEKWKPPTVKIGGLTQQQLTLKIKDESWGSNA
jgi:hypothetical protein